MMMMMILKSLMIKAFFNFYTKKINDAVYAVMSSSTLRDMYK